MTRFLQPNTFFSQPNAIEAPNLCLSNSNSNLSYSDSDYDDVTLSDSDQYYECLHCGDILSYSHYEKIPECMKPCGEYICQGCQVLKLYNVKLIRGKYKGKTFLHVYKNYQNYTQWVCLNLHKSEIWKPFIKYAERKDYIS